MITPVANLDPVLLSGTIVKRASLHNEDIIRSLDIHEHDMLYVEKGGEIIPKITGVKVEEREPDAPLWSLCMNVRLAVQHWFESRERRSWVCPNKYGCPPQIVGRIEHFGRAKDDEYRRYRRGDAQLFTMKGW